MQFRVNCRDKIRSGENRMNDPDSAGNLLANVLSKKFLSKGNSDFSAI